MLPSKESRSGVTSPEVAASLGAAGHALLEHLRSAPPFRFAVVGVEAYEAMTFGDLVQQVAVDPASLDGPDGLVVSDDALPGAGAGPRSSRSRRATHGSPTAGESFTA